MYSAPGYTVSVHTFIQKGVEPGAIARHPCMFAVWRPCPRNANTVTVLRAVLRHCSSFHT